MLIQRIVGCDRGRKYCGDRSVSWGARRTVQPFDPGTSLDQIFLLFFRFIIFHSLGQVIYFQNMVDSCNRKKQTRNVVSILDNWSSVLFSGLGLCRSLHAETLKTRKMSKKQTTKYRSIDEVMRLSYRSRTRVQKAAQVARRMGRSLVEFRALTHSRQLRRLTRKGNLKVKHPQGLKNCAGCTRKDHFKFPFVSVSKWLQE